MAHFFAVYSLASLSDMGLSTSLTRLAVVAVSIGAALINLYLLSYCVRPNSAGFLKGLAEEEERFWRSAAGSGAFISLVAVLWQGLPAALPL
jgi:hypothetical protein